MEELRGPEAIVARIPIGQPCPLYLLVEMTFSHSVLGSLTLGVQLVCRHHIPVPTGWGKSQERPGLDLFRCPGGKW